MNAISGKYLPHSSIGSVVLASTVPETTAAVDKSFLALPLLALVLAASISLRLDGCCGVYFPAAAAAEDGPLLLKGNALSARAGVVLLIVELAFLSGVQAVDGDASEDASADREAAAAVAEAAMAAGERYVKVFCLVAGVPLTPLTVVGVLLLDAYLLDSGVPGAECDSVASPLSLHSESVLTLLRNTSIEAKRAFNSLSGSAEDSNMGIFTSKIRTCATQESIYTFYKWNNVIKNNWMKRTF